MSEISHTEVMGFVYPALDDPETQIRLLRSIPGEDIELRFCLEVFQRETAPDFTAISYTCGDINDPATLYFDVDLPAPQPIYVDDQVFMTADNCSYVLRQALPHYRGGLVWIDQICINQADDAEKSAQVQTMDRFYAKAVTVLACLGPHFSNSQLVMEAACDAPRIGWSDDDIEEDEEYDSDGSEHWIDYELKQARWALDQGKEGFDRLCTALEAFGERRYWSRLWIVREIACAQNAMILCGGQAAPWRGFQILDGICRTSISSEKIIEKWGTNPDYEAGFFEQVAAYAFAPNSRDNEMRAPDLDDALDIFREFGCKDPRDRIHGILPLVGDLDRDAIVVDYSRSSFDLASRVVPRIGLLAVPDLLLTLQLDSHDGDVQEQRLRRRLEVFATLSVTSYNEPRNYKRLTTDLSFATVELDELGNLTAHLSKKEADLVEPQLPQLPEQYFKEVWDLVQPRMGNIDYRRIMVGSDTAILACKDAQAGDILLPFGATIAYERHDLHLVLRQNAEGTHDIIGQAIAMHGYRICGITMQGWPSPCKCVDNSSSHREIQSADVDVDLTAQDVVMLWTQDTMFTAELYRTVNGYHRMLRLDTAVTASPRGAVKLTRRN